MVSPPPPTNARFPIAAARLAAVATLSIPLLMLFVDRPLALAMESLPVWLRDGAGDITSLGKSLVWLLLSAGLFVFWTWRANRTERGTPMHWQHRRRSWAAAFLFAVIALSGILTNLIKLIVGRSRPHEFLADGFYEFSPWHLDADLRSFPSGHTTTVFALAFGIAMIRPAWRVPAFALAIVISATRIIINAHYLSDVIGGMVVALVTAICLKLVCERYGWNISPASASPATGDQKPRIAP
jgi:membrane-associated phospholipid phosphatase